MNFINKHKQFHNAWGSGYWLKKQIKSEFFFKIQKQETIN